MAKPTINPFVHEVPCALRDLACPCCGGYDLTVMDLYAHFPGDAIMVNLVIHPRLAVGELDGSSGDKAWITLIVECAGCGRTMDFYLHDGEIRSTGSVEDDPETARGSWLA